MEQCSTRSMNKVFGFKDHNIIHWISAVFCQIACQINIYLYHLPHKVRTTMKQMTEILVKFMIEEESELKINKKKLYPHVDCKIKLTIQVP